MFLEHVLASNLLPPNPETNVLKDFQLNVKKTLVSQVVTFLREPSTRPGILSSQAHVRWVLETCGQGFTLPIEDEAIIVAVTELYRKWALDPTSRPPCIEDLGLHQSFLQDLLKHFSLAFQSRAPSGLLEKHAQLCGRILGIYLDLGRNHGRSISLETWEVFLRLVIGIADSLLSPVTSDDNLGKKLCSQILKVTFELWLHSRTRNPTMWTALQALVPNWFHHDKFIEQWNSTCLALTTRSLILMYSANDKERNSSGVSLVRDDTQVIKMDDDYVYYSWYKFLYIIGNPNALRHAPIFLHGFQGIEKLVMQYLAVGVTEKIKTLPPDGNTILHIFGHWLFEAILQDRAGFDEGTALAVKILCNIVCAKPYSRYLPVYLGSFCTCLSESLKKEGRVLISAIMHCQELFTYEIQGSRVLVPYFIYAIGRILQKKVSSFDHIEQGEVVRRACIKILYTLFALPNHFGTEIFQMKPANGNAHANVLDVENFLQLKTHINTILLDALRLEGSPTNIQMLLYTVFAYQWEDITNSSDFTKQAIQLIIARTTSSSSAWPTDVALTAIKVLSMMVALYPYLEGANEQASFIVTSLCKYIIQQCDKLEIDKDTNTEIEALVSESFMTVANWVLLDTQWLLEDRDLIATTLKAIVVALNGKEIEKKTGREIIDKKGGKDEGKNVKRFLILSDKIHESADFFLFQLLTHFGNFPPSSGAHRVSTLVSEEDLLLDTVLKSQSVVNKPFETKNSIRYFSLENGSILTLIDRPFEIGGAATTLILRDKTGKHAWNFRPSYLKLALQNLPPVRPSSLDEREVATDVFINSSPDTDPATLVDIYSFYEKKKEPSLVGLTVKQLNTEKQVLQKRRHGLESDIAVTLPESTFAYNGENKFHQSRLLLSELGYLSPFSRQSLTLLEQSPQFFRNLKILDTNISERECQRITVMYVGRGQVNEADYATNLGGSQDYQEFVSSLGWGIENKAFEGVVYYGGYNVEVHFHVGTLIPNSEKDDNAQKRRQLNSSPVAIVWSEDAESFRPNYKLTLSPSVHINIQPLSSGLYRIRIFHRLESTFGPLLDGMVIAKHSLGQLVRDTAMSGCRAAQGTVQTTMNKREKLLSETIKLYKKDTVALAAKGDPSSIVSAYGVFCNLPPNESSPAPSTDPSPHLPPLSPFPAYPYPSIATIPHYSLSHSTSSTLREHSNSNSNLNSPLSGSTPPANPPSSPSSSSAAATAAAAAAASGSGSTGSISISASRSPRVPLGHSPRSAGLTSSNTSLSRSPLTRN